MLTDDEITEVFEAMPNGIDGWLKAWGYKQFAQAIEKQARMKLIEEIKALAVEDSSVAYVLDKCFPKEWPLSSN